MLKRLLVAIVVGCLCAPCSLGYGDASGEGAGSGADPTAAPIVEPTGFYLLQGIDKFEAVPDKKIRKRKVAGLSARFSWAGIEPAPGVYDWAALDAEIARVKGLGKELMLRPLAGTHAPQWLYDAGAAWTLSKKGKRMPVPWDPVMLDNWAGFVAILGARYPDVALVHMGGPTADSAEMHLPAALLDADPEAIEKVFDAWAASIDAFDTAFPNTALSLNVSNPFKGNDGLARQVSEYAVDTLGTRATLQNNSLHAAANPGFRIIELLSEKAAEGVRVGFQMLCPSRNQVRFKGSFKEALRIGDSVGATYYEIYAGDVRHVP